MKIAFITLGYRPYRTSGLDLSGENLVRGLLDAGHNVTVIAGQRGHIAETHNHVSLQIYRLPLGKLDWIPFGYRAARLLEHLKDFDIIHFWDVQFGWAYNGPFVASIQHSFRQRLESLGRFTMRNSPTWLYRTLYYALARQLAEIPTCQRARLLMAGSACTRQEFIQHYHIAPEHVAISRHGIDTNFFHRLNDTQLLRDRLRIRADEPVLLFSGFITPRKGMEYLAMALPMIHPRPRLVITGEWRNRTYREYVWSYLEPVKDQVIETGFVPDTEMPAYFSLCDVYVSASLMEGFGLPLAEALACGTPVVAADVGATSEVAGPGGLIVPQRQPLALAQAVSSLLQDPQKRQEMAHLGREHVLQNFSLQTMLRDTLAAYERAR